MDDSSLIRAEIDRYFAAYEAHDARGCASVYTPDAVALSPWGPPARGREAIAAPHSEWFEAGERNKTNAIDDLLVDGDLAVCLLRYSADVPAADGGTEKVFGISLNSLKRQPDGSWKIRHTSLNELVPHETEKGS